MDRGRGRGASKASYNGSQPRVQQSNVLRGLGRGSFSNQDESIPSNSEGSGTTDYDDTSEYTSMSESSSGHSTGQFKQCFISPQSLPFVECVDSSQNQLNQPFVRGFGDDEPTICSSIAMGRGEAILNGKTSLTRNAKGPTIQIENKTPQSFTKQPDTVRKGFDQKTFVQQDVQKHLPQPHNLPPPINEWQGFPYNELRNYSRQQHQMTQELRIQKNSPSCNDAQTASLGATHQHQVIQRLPSHAHKHSAMNQWHGFSRNTQGQSISESKPTSKQFLEETQNTVIGEQIFNCSPAVQPPNNIEKQFRQQPMNFSQGDIKPSTANNTEDLNDLLICDDLGGGFGMDLTSEDRDTVQRKGFNHVSPHSVQNFKEIPPQSFPKRSTTSPNVPDSNTSVLARHSPKNSPVNQFIANTSPNPPTDANRHQDTKLVTVLPRKSLQYEHQKQSVSYQPVKNRGASYTDSTGQVWVAPSVGPNQQPQESWRKSPNQGNWRNNQWGGHQGNARNYSGNWKNMEPNQEGGNWRAPSNQRPVNWNNQSEQRQGHWNKPSNDRTASNWRTQNTPVKAPAPDKLTMEQMKNEFEWQRFKVVRKVKKAISTVMMDEVKTKAKEISDILEGETTRLASFPATWPKERHVALEEILDKAVQDEEFRPIAGHLIREIYELKPDRFKEIMHEVLLKKEPEYVKVSTAANSGKVRMSYCSYLSSVLSASGTESEDNKFNANVASVIIRLIQRWLYFDIKGNHTDMEEYLTVLCDCLTILVKLLLPHLSTDQQKKVFNLIKDKALSSAQRTIKLSMLNLLLQWSSGWKDDLFYVNYLYDPDTSEALMKVNKPSANSSVSNKDSDAAINSEVSDNNDAERSDINVVGSATDVSNMLAKPEEESAQKSSDVEIKPGANVIKSSSTSNWWEDDVKVTETKDEERNTEATGWHEEESVEPNKSCVQRNTEATEWHEEKSVEPNKSYVQQKGTIDDEDKPFTPVL
ncbi:uncharacterized protein [Antedon mediterranea]|uniref:uncharacterized protein n=1 Tax=Antedon mediterranea TaxID=105859 RepID=UPI003AF63F71